MKVIMDIDKDGVKPGESRRFTLEAGVVTARKVKVGDDVFGWVIEVLQRHNGSLVFVGEAGQKAIPNARMMWSIAERVMNGSWTGWKRFNYTSADVAQREAEIMQELVRDAKAVGLTKSDAKPKAFEPQSDGSLLVRFEVGHLSAEMRVERGDWKEDAGGASLAH